MQHIKTPVDLTALTCITKADVQQAIDTAYPFDKQGFIVWAEIGSFPDVTADPVWAYFFVGELSSGVPTKQFYFWNGSSWELIPLVDGSLLAPNSVPLSKLKLTGTAAFDIIQVNSTNNALIFTSIPTAIQNNTIPANKLLMSDAVNNYVLTSFAGVVSFTEMVAYYTAIADKIIPVSKIAPGSADPLRRFLSTKIDGSLTEWVTLDVANLYASGSSALQGIRRNSLNTAWEFYNAPQQEFEVFASQLDIDPATLDVNLTVALPPGCTTWKKIEMYAITVFVTGGGGTDTLAVTMKWNCGTLLDTPVTIGVNTGAGNSGVAFGGVSSVSFTPTTMFTGVVPVAINTVANLVARASLTAVDSPTLEPWSFWIKATCV